MPSIRDLANVLVGSDSDSPGDLSLDLPEISSDTYQFVIFCMLIGKIILIAFLLWLKRKNASLTARLKWQ
ncbi:TPA_asm: P6 [Pogostemom alphacytorhabdovirus 2]|nr:TPA_asm: P6 [Pogostemom alphacytorhabdovirus 2]